MNSQVLRIGHNNHGISALGILTLVRFNSTRHWHRGKYEAVWLRRVRV